MGEGKKTLSKNHATVLCDKLVFSDKCLETQTEQAPLPKEDCSALGSKGVCLLSSSQHLPGVCTS